jgi:archaeal flagellar protein FlaG
MSADTFTTAMFLITAVIAAGVLVNAIFPVVYNMAGTFSSSSHESDQRLRTDFKIIATSASAGGHNGQVWIKNIGSTRILSADIIRSDVFTGPSGNFDMFAYTSATTLTSEGTWTAELNDLNGNGNWDSGETLKVSFKFYNTKTPTSGSDVYFQFVLPDGIWRSSEFTAGG